MSDIVSPPTCCPECCSTELIEESIEYNENMRRVERDMLCEVCDHEWMEIYRFDHAE